MLPPPDILYLFLEKPTIMPLIKALEDKVGFEIGLQPKTIKRALGKTKNTPRTQAKLNVFFQKLAETSGVSRFDNKHIGDSMAVYSYWSFWLSFSEYTDHNFPLGLFPATRVLIRQMACQERDKIAFAHERFGSFPERLLFFVGDKSQKKSVVSG